MYDLGNGLKKEEKVKLGNIGVEYQKYIKGGNSLFGLTRVLQAAGQPLLKRERERAYVML